jgi:hypothetical protein
VLVLSVNLLTHRATELIESCMSRQYLKSTARVGLGR